MSHPTGRKQLGRMVVTVARLVVAKIYRRHVAYEFLPGMLAHLASIALPPGYEQRQPLGAGDEDAIADLLNQEPGYGRWTSERVRTELYAHLATPFSAIMILHSGIPIGVSFAVDASTRRRQIAHGMYLYVASAHRGRAALGLFLIRSTLKACVEGGYPCVIGYTDPHRFPALLLYLSYGAQPVYDSLISRWYWRKIKRRLAPALRRAQQQQARRMLASEGSPRQH